jgi:hypothetical protein
MEREWGYCLEAVSDLDQTKKSERVRSQKGPPKQGPNRKISETREHGHPLTQAALICSGGTYRCGPITVASVTVVMDRRRVKPRVQSLGQARK